MPPRIMSSELRHQECLSNVKLRKNKNPKNVRKYNTCPLGKELSFNWLITLTILAVGRGLLMSVFMPMSRAELKITLPVVTTVSHFKPLTKRSRIPIREIAYTWGVNPIQLKLYMIALNQPARIDCTACVILTSNVK